MEAVSCVPSCKRARISASKEKTILNLNDECLAYVFSLLSPLDLFNASRTCTRFRDQALSRRSWLCVSLSPSTDILTDDRNVDAPSPPSRYRQYFPTLLDAVAASRPGETIFLEPSGKTPHEASGIVINHPIHILGGGDTPEDCVIICSTSGVDPILSFNASGRVSNLTMTGGMGGCVAHLHGRLEIEDCFLKSAARGLRHLTSPLLSIAHDSSRNSAAAVVVVPSSVSHPASLGFAPPPPPPPSTDVRLSSLKKLCHYFQEENSANEHRDLIRSRLCVIGCGLEGGSRAVKVEGDGAVLHSVRVIYEGFKSLFWLQVDHHPVGGSTDEKEEEEEEEVHVLHPNVNEEETGYEKYEDDEERKLSSTSSSSSSVSASMLIESRIRSAAAQVQTSVEKLPPSPPLQSTKTEKESDDVHRGCSQHLPSVERSSIDVDVDVVKKAEIWKKSHARLL